MPSAAAIAFHLDTVVPETGDEAGEITGWIFGREGAHCCAVRLRSGAQATLAVHGLPRPDVHASYPGESGAPTSGFRVCVGRSGRAPLVLEWMDEAGRWHEFWRKARQVSRGASARPELPVSLLSFVVEETAAANRDGTGRDTWRHARRLVEACSQRFTPWSADGDWLACLDEPAGEILSGQYVALSGWVFGRSRPIARVFAQAEPRGLVHVIHPLPRPDVAAAYAALGAPVACGFAGMIRLPPPGSPWFVLRLYVETRDGTTHLVLTRRCFVGNAAGQGERDWRTVFAVGALALGGHCRLASWSGWWRELRACLQAVPPRPAPADAPEPFAPASAKPALQIDPRPDDPLLSILVPVFNPVPRHLCEMIASVRAQHYPRWELCLADDASPAPRVRPLLEQFAREDARIRAVFRTENGQIARATNSALALARGEFVAFLDQDDLLAPEVLLRVIETVRADAGVQFLYTDRDKVDDRRHHYDVERRGAWNPAMAITHNYLHQLTVIRRGLVERVGGCRAEYFGSQDLDLYLRCQEWIEPGQIRHVPVIGYHWRAHPGSTASRGDQKSYMFDSARRGIEDALRRRGLRATPFLPDFAPFYGLNLHQLRWDAALLRENPVSVVLAVASPAEDWTAAVAALARTIPAGTVQLIIVAAGRIARVQDWPMGWRPAYVALPAGTPVAGLFNHGASLASHALLLLQDARAVPSEPGWLEDLVGWLSVPGVDAAGPKLIAADGLVASAGWTIDPVTGLPQPWSAGRAVGELGPQFLAHVARDSLLLDRACLLTRTARFREAGGYAAEDFPAAFFAADYCLRLQGRGRRVVFTPQATLRWAGDAGNESETMAREAATFRLRHAGRTDPWIAGARIPAEEVAKAPVGASWQEWMPAGTVEFPGGWFFLEHPRPGSVLPDGRVVVRGWCLARPGHPMEELRLRVGERVHWLTSGHPRADLAAAAGRAGEFLPVGFDLEIDLPAGAARLDFEVSGEIAVWQQVERLEVTVQSGARFSREMPVSWIVQLAEGAELLAGSSLAGTLAARARTLARVTPWRERARSPALPFHGYWDEPTGLLRPVYGGVEIRGWLFHETRTVRRVVAGFSPTERLPLAHQCESDVIARRFASFPNAARCAVSGFVPVRASGSLSRVLRIWAELDDGSWHLVYVRRSWLVDGNEDGHGRRGNSFPRKRALLALWCALLWGGPASPGLPALWGAMRQLRQRFSHEESSATVPPLAAVPGQAPRDSHVLLVTHNLNQEGAPYFLLELARYVKRETGARMSLVSPAEGPLRRDFERSGIVVRVLDRKPLWQARTSREASHALAALAGEVRAEEASVVIANTIESFWAVLAARQAGRPSLFYIHEPGVFGVHYLGDLAPAGRALAARALAEASRVSFPSRAAQDYYRRFTREANRCIQPGWTDLDRLLTADGSQRRAAMRQQLGLAHDDLLVINVGTMCPRKGQLHFVAAAGRLRRDHPGLAARCRFLMIGANDNIHGDVLRAQIAAWEPGHGISLVSATPEIGDYFSAADLFVLTSFEEGFPRVVLEAMGFGLPIVSTSVHAIPEIVRDGHEALLVPPGDAGALAGAMRRMLEDRELAQRLGEQAQFRVEANFTAERVLPRHLRTILGLAPELRGAGSKIPASDLPDTIPAAS